MTEIDVVGIATDYCVRASALDALAAGRTVRVLADLVAAVDPATVPRHSPRSSSPGGIITSST